MGMMLDDLEQKLFYKILVEELKSYGFNDEGKQVAGKVRPSDLEYVRLMLRTLKRIEKSVKREHARKKRIAQTIERIDQKIIENQEDS